MARNTNTSHNPELDYEYKEEKQENKGVPLLYRDYDGVAEPYEMFAINRLNGVKTKGWKDILLKIVIVAIVFLIGGLLLFVVVPWIIHLFDPSYNYTSGLFFGE